MNANRDWKTNGVFYCFLLQLLLLLLLEKLFFQFFIKNKTTKVNMFGLVYIYLYPLLPFDCNIIGIVLVLYTSVFQFRFFCLFYILMILYFHMIPSS